MYMVPIYFEISYFPCIWIGCLETQSWFDQMLEICWQFKTSIMQWMGISACSVASVGMKSKDLI